MVKKSFPLRNRWGNTLTHGAIFFTLTTVHNKADVIFVIPSGFNHVGLISSKLKGTGQTELIKSLKQRTDGRSGLFAVHTWWVLGITTRLSGIQQALD